MARATDVTCETPSGCLQHRAVHARTNTAHARACAPRQSTSTHNTARAEDNRGEKEEEERGRVKGQAGEGKGRWRGRGMERRKESDRLVKLATGGDALHAPFAARISSALALCRMVLASLSLSALSLSLFFSALSLSLSQLSLSLSLTAPSCLEHHHHRHEPSGSPHACLCVPDICAHRNCGCSKEDQRMHGPLWDVRHALHPYMTPHLFAGRLAFLGKEALTF